MTISESPAERARRDAMRPTLLALSRKLADEGKLIEAGWVSMRLAVIHPDAPDAQLREMRMAYMAGAQHLFSSIMSILDPGSEPTDADLRRMDLINAELGAFVEEMRLRTERPKGSA